MDIFEELLNVFSRIIFIVLLACVVIAIACCYGCYTYGVKTGAEKMQQIMEQPKENNVYSS